jgi:pimeloyl-ACP methyl ester carboxylesterase
VLDHLLVQKVVVFGMTLGGMVALEMASTRPDRVVGLVLNDEGPERPPDWEGKMTAITNYDALTREEAIAKTRAYARKNYRPLSEEMIVRIARRGYRERPDGKWIRDFDPRTDEAKLIFRRERPKWWAELRATSAMPVEVLRGERSELLEQDIAERMTREHPDLRVHIVKGQGHPPLLDEPEVFAALYTLLVRVDAAHALPR